MAIFGRKEKPPAQLLGRLEGDERVVSWADTSDGSIVAATQYGLWWPFPDGLRLVRWQFVDKVVWREGALTLIEGELIDDLILVDRAPAAVTLRVPRDLPPTVRKRVEANIVKREVVTAPGGSTVRFVARREPGRDGVAWWAHVEAAASNCAEVRSAVEARLAILRSQPLSQ